MIHRLALALVGLLYTGATAWAMFGSSGMMVPFPVQTGGGGGGGGTIACGTGPNFTGTIPTIAQNAGLTTCAANYDFTSPSYSNPATYVACLGATGGAIQFYCNSPGLNMVVPTSGIIVTTDTGVSPNIQVLDLRWTASWSGTQCTGVGSFTCFVMLDMANANNTGVANSFPNGVYLEFTYRFTPLVTTAGCPAGGGSSNPCPYTSLYGWSDAAVASNSIEYDVLETYGGQKISYDAAWHDWGNGGTAQFIWQGMGNLPGGNVDPTVYNTWGFLETSDGSTSAVQCSFLNGSQAGTGCSTVDTTGAAGPGGFGQRTAFLMVNGANYCCTSIGTDVDMYVKSIRVWACAGWKTGQCYGTTKITSGNLTYWK